MGKRLGQKGRPITLLIGTGLTDPENSMPVSQ
jgi:hypothetical protein